MQRDLLSLAESTSDGVFSGLLSNLESLVNFIREKGDNPTGIYNTILHGIPSLIRLAKGREQVIGETLKLVKAFPSKWPWAQLRACLTALELTRHETWATEGAFNLVKVLFEMRLHPNDVEVELGRDIPILVIAARRNERIMMAVPSLVRASLQDRFLLTYEERGDILRYGLPVLVSVIGDQQESFDDLSYVLRDLMITLRDKGINSERVLNYILPILTRLADSPESFKRLLHEFGVFLSSLKQKDVYPKYVSKIDISVFASLYGKNEAQFKKMLADLERILTSGVIKGAESQTMESLRNLIYGLNVHEPFWKTEDPWDDLILPTIQSQKVGACLIFDAFLHLAKFIKTDADIAYNRIFQ